MDAASRQGSASEVLRAFLRLGCTSFGGPVAHLGYYRAEFVERRRWLDEATYADLVALCQFLPGPGSTQTAMSIGLLRAGPLGMLCAWIGFTLPSALAMLAAAYGIAALGDVGHAAWLKGLKLVAVAVVAQAVWGMARSLCPDRARASLAVAAAAVTLAIPSSAGQIAALLLGALVGLAILERPAAGGAPAGTIRSGIGRGVGVFLIVVFFVLLAALPFAAGHGGGRGLSLFAAFYQAGALVFGGGHVVLPLLQTAVVAPGWVDEPTFLAGYGAAQAVPGPIFTFAAFLGASAHAPPNGWLGALIATVAIFAPSFLLLGGILPFWEKLRRRAGVQAALRGVNAAVVGLLAAALYTPVWTGAVATPVDFALALAAFLLLTAWKTPPWIVVLLGAGAGALAGFAGAAL